MRDRRRSVNSPYDHIVVRKSQHDELADAMAADDELADELADELMADEHIDAMAVNSQPFERPEPNCDRPAGEFTQAAAQLDACLQDGLATEAEAMSDEASAMRLQRRGNWLI